MDMKDKISSRRKELGLTLEDVGNAVGVGKSTVRKWETGQIENMRQNKIALLAKVLKVSPAYLMGWQEEKLTTKNDDELFQKLKERPKLLELINALSNTTDEGLDAVINLAKMIDKEKSKD